MRWARGESPHGHQQAGLEIDIGGGEAVTVGHHLLHERQRGRMRVFHRADHRAEIEDQLGLEFAGELLHALVFHEAADLQELDAAVARGEQAAFEQRRADTRGSAIGFSMLKAASASRPRMRRSATPRSTPSTKNP